MAWDFPDQDILDYVGHGLDFGFSLCFTGKDEDLQDAVKHGAGARANPQIVVEYPQEEVGFGSMAGPFSSCPIQGLHLNKVNLIQKPGKEGAALRTKAFRLIVDLSHPETKSVNDFISEEDSSVQYTALEEIIDRVVARGPGCLLFKVCLLYASDAADE